MRGKTVACAPTRCAVNVQTHEAPPQMRHIHAPANARRHASDDMILFSETRVLLSTAHHPHAAPFCCLYVYCRRRERVPRQTMICRHRARRRMRKSTSFINIFFLYPRLFHHIFLLD